MAQTGKAFYTGSFKHTLDDKNRITIPAQWRAAHDDGETFLAVPQPDGYIAILPPLEAEKLHAKISAIALSDSAGQDFAARFFAQTQTLSFDKQGRIMLNAELLAHAAIKQDALLVGSANKFNLYSPARWSELEARTTGNMGELMRRMGI